MDRMLYVAMNGAQQTLLSQQVEVNNLANVNTPGFRADLSYFSSLYAQGDTHDSRVYSQAQPLQSDLSPGSMISTDNDMDIAVKGDGWIAVQTQDGNEAYTRVGNLTVSPNGILVTGSGYPILGNAGPIAVPPSEKIEIGRDGTISVRPLGQAANALAQVDRIRLVNPEKTLLQKGDDGLFHLKNGATATPDGTVQIVTGMLEGSNVNAISAMTNMISLARQFEVQLKLMRQAEEDSQASARILQLNG